LIGHPIERLLHEGRKGSINLRLRKNLNISIPITRLLHVKIELSHEQDPMEEIMEVSLLKASDKDLEEDAKDFIQDKEEPRNPFPLDET
jgi:hypothetical protein